MTSSPGPRPMARSDRYSASRPLATPIQCLTPRYRANSDSKASSSGPRMYQPLVATRRSAPSISSAASAWAARRSRNGMRGSVMPSLQGQVLVVVPDVVLRFVDVRGEHEEDGIVGILVLDRPHHGLYVEPQRGAVQAHLLAAGAVVQDHGAAPANAHEELVQGPVGVLPPHVGTGHVEDGEVSLGHEGQRLVDLAEGQCPTKV